MEEQIVRAFCTSHITQKYLDLLQEHLDIRCGGDPTKQIYVPREELIQALQGVDILIVSYEKIDEEVIHRCPDLKLIASERDGPEENVDIAAGIPVVHSLGRCVKPVAEHTFLLMLALNRRLLFSSRCARGTAIAALGSVVKAVADEIGYAMTAIFLFDIFSCLLYPYLALAMGLTPEQFSFFAGTAINDTSSVTAFAQQYANLTWNEAYAAGAVSIKLVRTAMLIFVVLAVTLVTLRTQAKSASEASSGQSVAGSVRRAFPWFILGFITMALLNTLGLLPAGFLTAFFKTGSKFLITCALVGTGFEMKFSDLFNPLLLGDTWISVAVSSMLFIHLFSGYVNGTGLFT